MTSGRNPHDDQHGSKAHPHAEQMVSPDTPEPDIHPPLTAANPQPEQRSEPDGRRETTSPAADSDAAAGAEQKAEPAKSRDQRPRSTSPPNESSTTGVSQDPADGQPAQARPSPAEEGEGGNVPAIGRRDNAVEPDPRQQPPIRSTWGDGHQSTSANASTQGISRTCQPREGLGSPRRPPTTPDAEGDADVDEQRASLSSEEDVLRRLLRDSVQNVQPTPDALDRLRRAVPARRAHRRQIMIGVAASVLLAVTAIPSVVHTATTASGSTSRPDSQTSGQPGRDSNDTDSSTPTRGPGAEAASGSQGKGDSKGAGSEKSVPPSTSRSHGSTQGSDPSRTLSANPPSCLAGQFGQPSAMVGAAEADGKIYGTFQVVNVSMDPCLVSDTGKLSVLTRGSADSSRIQILPHTVGDGATALPNGADQPLVLNPGTSFVVRFGWVPDSGTGGCVTTSGSDPGGGAATSGRANGAGDGGAAPEEPTGDSGEPASGTVLVTYTPDAGVASATGELDHVCAGTVYHTPPLVGG